MADKHAGVADGSVAWALWLAWPRRDLSQPQMIEQLMPRSGAGPEGRKELTRGLTTAPVAEAEVGASQQTHEALVDGLRHRGTARSPPATRGDRGLDVGAAGGRPANLF